MELLRYFIVLCLFFCTEAERERHYGYEFDEVAKVWFKLHRLRATWHGARKSCEMEGAIMSSPLNKPMKDAFDYYTRTYKIKQFFVGVHSTFASGVWHTIEGVSLEELMYIDMDQFNEVIHSCSVLSDGSLISTNCSEKYPYICYRRTNEKLIPCGTTDKEYKLEKKTGHCYKFHKFDKKTFQEAVRTCSSEQAYLAIINSDAEAQVLTNIFKNSGYYPNAVRLGVIDWEQNGKWYTVHGERLQDSGYSKWVNTGPLDNYQNKYCGVLRPDGLMSFESCIDKVVFICEKEVRNMDYSENSTDALHNAIIHEEYYR